MLLDEILQGLNSEIQSENLHVLIQLRQLVLQQNGWLSSGEVFKEWPLQRKFQTLPSPVGLLKEYLQSSPRMEEMFRLWDESDIAVQREVIRTLTAILFCARNHDTVSVCRRILHTKAGPILDTIVLALGGSHNINNISSSSSQDSAQITSSVASKVATSSFSTLSASEKLTLLSAVSSHASNITRDLLSNHELRICALLKHTATLAKVTHLTGSSSSRKRRRSDFSAPETLSLSSLSSKKIGPKLKLQTSILRFQLSFLQYNPSDIKRQALDIKGFIRAMLLWQHSSNHAQKKITPLATETLKLFQEGTNCVVMTLAQDLLLTKDLSRSMKRRLFGTMVLEYLVSLSNVGDTDSLELLRRICVHPSSCVFDKEQVWLEHGNKKGSSTMTSTLLHVLKTLHATSDRSRQDLVCEMLETYSSLIVPYSRAFPYDVEAPADTFNWLGAAVLATRVHQIQKKVPASELNANGPIRSFSEIVPSSNKFTKVVLGKGLQSSSLRVASTTISYIESMFDVVESFVLSSKSSVRGIQQRLPEFSVLRSLLNKKYSDNQNIEAVKFREQLLVLMGKYLIHAPATAQRVRYDGCAMLKNFGDLSCILSASKSSSFRLCDGPVLELLNASAKAQMLQWGNFLKRVQLNTKDILVSTNSNAMTSWVAAAASLFPVSLEITPLRPLLFTMALASNIFTFNAASQVVTQAVVHNGGIFATAHAHDSIAAFFNCGYKSLTIPMTLFIDACLTRSIRDSLELTMKYPKETSKWGIFAVVVVDTLKLILQARVRRNSTSSLVTNACRDISQYVITSLREFSLRFETKDEQTNLLSFVETTLGMNISEEVTSWIPISLIFVTAPPPSSLSSSSFGTLMVELEKVNKNTEKNSENVWYFETTVQPLRSRCVEWILTNDVTSEQWNELLKLCIDGNKRKQLSSSKKEKKPKKSPLTTPTTILEMLTHPTILFRGLLLVDGWLNYVDKSTTEGMILLQEIVDFNSIMQEVVMNGNFAANETYMSLALSRTSNMEIPSTMMRVCRLARISSDHGTVLHILSSIVQRLDSSTVFVDKSSSSEMAAFYQRYTIASESVLQLLRSIDFAKYSENLIHLARLLVSSKDATWVQSTSNLVIEVVRSCCLREANNGVLSVLRILSPRISNSLRQESILKLLSPDSIELATRQHLLVSLHQRPLLQKYQNQDVVLYRQTMKFLQQHEMTGLHKMMDTKYRGLNGVSGTSEITSNTIARLWNSSEKNGESLLLRCLESRSSNHIVSSWNAICSTLNKSANSTAFSNWSPSCFLCLLEASGGFNENVPTSFLKAIKPCLFWILNLWATADLTQESYYSACLVWSKLVGILCEMQVSNGLPAISNLSEMLGMDSNTEIVSGLIYSVKNSTTSATAPSSSSKKSKKRKREHALVKDLVPAPQAVLLHFLMTNPSSKNVLFSPEKPHILEWGKLCATQLKTTISKSKNLVTFIEIFYRNSLIKWLQLLKENKSSLKDEDQLSGMLNGVLVALFKNRVNANDVFLCSSVDGVSANKGRQAPIPLHLLKLLVNSMDWNLEILAGIGGKRQLLTMILEHSKFDTIMESSNTRLRSNILNLLHHIRSAMNVEEIEENEEKTSIFVLSHILQHYGATLSNVDRLLRVIIEGERERMRNLCKRQPGKSRMFEVQSSLWGESARLRKGTLFSKDTSLALHERWDEWFFGKQDNDGKMTGYGLRSNLLSRTVENYPVNVSCTFDMKKLHKDERKSVSGEEEEERDRKDQLYDPSFIIPALRSIMIVSPIQLVDLFRQGPLNSLSSSSHYSHSVVALVVQATSSSCPILRMHAYDILARVYDILAVEVPQIGSLGLNSESNVDEFPHREQISYLFRSWRNSLVLEKELITTMNNPNDENNEYDKKGMRIEKEQKQQQQQQLASSRRVPGIIASFIVESIRVLQRPGHPLYLQINQFLMSRIALDLEDVPMWYQCFNSGKMTPTLGSSNKGRHYRKSEQGNTSQLAKIMQGVDHVHEKNNDYISDYSTKKGRGNPERLWILRVIANGLSSKNDTQLCARRHIMGAMISFHASPLANISDRPSQDHVLRLLQNASKVPSLAKLMSTSGIIPWLQRLPSGVGRLDTNKGVDWWSWELLSTTVGMLERMLLLTENRSNDEDDRDAEDDESLNVHRVRLSSLSHACVHLFRKSMSVFKNVSKIVSTSALSSLSSLSSMLWRIYTCANDIRLEYDAMRKQKRSGGEQLTKEQTENVTFDHPAVYMGINISMIHFMLDHQFIPAVNLMTTLRCPASQQHSLQQFPQIKSMNSMTYENVAFSGAILQSWENAILSCIKTMIQEANTIIQQRAIYIYSDNQVQLNTCNLINLENDCINDEKLKQWNFTVKKFFEWCTASMLDSDIIRTIFENLPSNYGPLYSLLQVSIQFGNSKTTKYISSVLEKNENKSEKKTETPLKKKKSKKDKKNSKKRKKNQ